MRNYDSCILHVDPDGSFTFTDDWDQATVIVFNELDQKGIEHEFNNVTPGMLIDVFNAADDGFMVATVGERIANAPDGRIAFHIQPEQHQGAPGGLAGVKIFSVEDSVDLANYVRKSGDTMTGQYKTGFGLNRQIARQVAGATTIC